MIKVLLSLAFFFTSTYAFADNDQATAFAIGFLLVISVTIVLIYQSKNKPQNYSKVESDSLQDQAEESFVRLKGEGITTLNDVPILLRNGETAFLTESSDLFELETTYLTGGISTSNQDIVGGVARSTPVDQMSKLDSGSFTLTDQRIVFLGKNKTREFELPKILGVRVQGNCVVIEGGQEGKNSLFSVKNPYFWGRYIQKLAHRDKP